MIRQAATLAHWVAENARTTRAFLKRVEAVVPLAQPLQSISIVELPRAPKGRGAVAGAEAELDSLLAPSLQGHDIGLASEAGLPAIADPGAALVRRARAPRRTRAAPDRQSRGGFRRQSCPARRLALGACGGATVRAMLGCDAAAAQQLCSRAQVSRVLRRGYASVAAWQIADGNASWKT